MDGDPTDGAPSPPGRDPVEWAEYRANRDAFWLGWSGYGGPEARDRYVRRVKTDQFVGRWGPRFLWLFLIMSIWFALRGSSSTSGCGTRGGEWACDQLDYEP